MVVPKGPVYSKSAYDITPLAKERIDELAGKLTPDQAKVILRKGTEPAFCGDLHDNHKVGTYCCRLCGLPLFESCARTGRVAASAQSTTAMTCLLMNAPWVMRED